MRSDRLSVAQRAALAAIRLYKLLISPMFTGSCRFMPSCSDYAREALVRFGVLRGSFLAVRRLGRCHPLGSHGFDPALPSMRALFLARGPAFVPGARLPVFDNLDVYPLLTLLLHVPPQDHDGSADVFAPALR